MTGSGFCILNNIVGGKQSRALQMDIFLGRTATSTIELSTFL